MTALRILIGFLYRLVLFLPFATQAMVAAFTNQLHWLITGMTFEQIAQANRKPSLDELLRRQTRH